jgi:hypothetical protein
MGGTATFGVGARGHPAAGKYLQHHLCTRESDVTLSLKNRVCDATFFESAAMQTHPRILDYPELNSPGISFIDDLRPLNER